MTDEQHTDEQHKEIIRRCKSVSRPGLYIIVLVILLRCCSMDEQLRELRQVVDALPRAGAGPAAGE